MTKRKSRNGKERLRLLVLHGGVCHMCKHKIQLGEKWELSHVIEWELTHDDSDENVKPAHFKCHRTYTYETGNPMVAKVLRLERKHLGIKTNKRPIPQHVDPWGKQRKSGGFVRREER